MPNLLVPPLVVPLPEAVLNVLDVLDVPALLLEVDVLIVRDVVVNEVLDVPVLLLEVEVDVLVVREVLDVLVLLLEVEVDVLVVLVVVVQEVLDVLVVDVCTRSRKTVCKGHTLLRSFERSMQNDF